MRNFGGQQSLKGDGYRGLAGLFCCFISLSENLGCEKPFFPPDFLEAVFFICAFYDWHNFEGISFVFPVGLMVFSCEVLCSFLLSPQTQPQIHNHRCQSWGRSTSRPMKSHCGVWHQYLALRNRPECHSRMAHNCLLSQVRQWPLLHSVDMGIAPSRCHRSLFSRMSYQRSSSRS